MALRRQGREGRRREKGREGEERREVESRGGGRENRIGYR